MYRLARIAVRARRLARQLVGSATYGFAVSLTCLASLIYTGVGLFLTAATCALTAAVAAVCWLVSGE